MEQKLDIQTPTEKIYKDRAIWVGTFLGGPLVAGYLIAENFKVFNDSDRAKKTWIYTIIATIVIFGGTFLIPDNVKISNQIIPLTYTAITYYLVQHFQGQNISTHIKAGGQLHSWQRTIVIGIIGLAITIIPIFGIAFLSDSIENISISTQSQSNDRIKNLNLDKSSEDASYILDTNKLSIPNIVRETEKAEYKADPDREWIINLIPVDGALFKKEDFSKIFDYDWRSKYQSTIFGFSEEEHRWTYADAGGTPDVYSKLQVAIDIQDVFNEENPNYDPQKLKRYINELEKRIKNYPTTLKLEQTETIESAISKAKKLVQLSQEFNLDAVIVLQADKQFKGLEMWDALQSVGLKWGDGDLFHWRNDKDYGHDQHFSVWTTTEPGYFLPEEIKDGNMNPQNLVFGFSIPRSADPKNIFEIMLNSVKYCQKRLGGQILDRNMDSFNEEKERQKLLELLKRMEQKDLNAGSNKVLRMF